MYRDIILEYPYTEHWDTGSVRDCEDGRYRVTLWKDGKRMGTAYARYLMAVKLGRYLTKEETVDHIDEDKTNDDIGNLQILTLSENVKKQHRFRGSVREGDNPVECLLECGVCNKGFTKLSRVVRYANKMGFTLTCSRSCRGKLPKTYTKPKAKVQSDDIVNKAREHFIAGDSSYTAAEALGISRRQVTNMYKGFKE